MQLVSSLQHSAPGWCLELKEQILLLLLASGGTLLWSHTGYQKGFPPSFSLWQNNLSPWQHLANLTQNQNRNVKIVGEQVNHISLHKTRFSLFSLCSETLSEKIATSVGPRKGQRWLAEAWHWLVLHIPFPTPRKKVFLSESCPAKGRQ